MRPTLIWFLLSALLMLFPCFLLASMQFSSLAQQHADAPLISYDIKQDQKGYIWFASELDGLQRFDGYELSSRNILTDTELQSVMANVNQLLVDSQQQLWVSTWGQGVTLLDQQLRISMRYHTKASPAQQLPSDRVQSFFEDQQQRIWIGTVEGLRYVHTADPSRLHQVQLLPDIRVWQVTQSDNGTLWLATSRGLYSLSADLQHLEHKPQPALRDEDVSLNPAEIRTLLLVEQGIWLGTQLGLFFFSFELGQITSRYPAELGVINTLFQPEKDQLWVGSGAGLFRINTGSTQPQSPEHFLQTADIRKFFKDQTGVIWVASRNRGVFKMNPLPENFKAVPLPQKPGMAEKTLRRIYSQTIIDDRIWLGVDHDLVSYDLLQQRWHTHSLPTRRPHNQIQAITRDPYGQYWVGTDLGLFVSAAADKEFSQQHLPETIRQLAGITAVAADPDGSLWLGIWEKGLVKWPQQNPQGQLEHYSITSQPGDAVISMINDNSDSIWMVSRFSGLYQLERSTGLITRYHSGSDSLIRLPSEVLLCLEKVNEYQFWVCTNQGLFFMDLKQNQSELYQVAQGLPDNRVVAINAREPGSVWVSTKRGLAELNLTSKTFRLFAEKANINALLLETRALNRTDSGQFWLGTAAGLYEFTPRLMQDYTFNAHMVISKLKADQKQWLDPQSTAEDPLEVPAQTKEISINFSFLEYFFTDGHQYQYRFSGSDREWHYIGHQHQVSFNRLPPGHYSFEVRNSLEHSEHSTARLYFVIPTPWWQDKRLWLFVCLVGLLMLWLMWQSRTRNLHQQNSKLNELVRQRTADLEQANLALNQQARTDFLTKLPNRLAFSEQFELLQRQAIRQKSSFTLVLLDIDHFKAINDSYGHDAGDVVLAKVAQSLSQRLRQQDVLARWGGEEFILLLPDTSVQGALVVCEVLRQCLMQMDIIYDDQQILVTATFGVAQLNDLQLDLVRWQSAADIALYQGKKTGRNKVVVYQEDTADSAE
ncbi:MAG: diguanylate cyclase [Gammaproteobacteria bacterium]|nr:diguanylate cyclase [Gammaproteobacteria bacterium]MBU2056766.1 diguanylate cyclase [Gammaproteobacteria bacterium]MBU2174103.1 diguanylate cyclase [Gammaproteobacteria bacterium]MBU2246991.1 diguanylate cyclase [Gammaproteobacteria bacterium]MBU2343417.1 diguanylate cyclase [Gammaproteobacteria bacterium]